MFFVNEHLGPKRKTAMLRVLPPIPKTNWQCPRNPPNVASAVVFGLDVETYDPDLLTKGPGWARGVGHLVGVSLAAQDHSGNQAAWYFPLRHEVDADTNLNPDLVLPWLQTVLGTNIPKIGANITYDVGWLQQENVYVQGYLHDVQFAEALLDETAKTALDDLAEKYLGLHKVTTLLYEWCKAAYSGSLKEQRKNIYRSPASLVGPYAEADALLPLQILSKQWKLLESEELLTVYDLECRLIRLMIQMRFAGITVNVDKAHELYDTFGKDVINNYEELYKLTRIHGSVASNQDVAKMFDSIGIKYKQTDNGNPSITKDFLATLDHPAAKLINNIRELEKLRSTFLKGCIIEGSINNKLYPQLNQLRNDSDEDGKKGAKTGRFSGDLQQIPSRSVIGKQIKKLFIPHHGHTVFIKTDADQFEYKLLAHYAVGPGSDELRAKYNNDPKTDYHKSVQDDMQRIVGVFIERKLIKNVNFGLIYGSGEPKLAKTAGISLEDSAVFFKNYHAGVPYVKKTMEAIIKETIQKGYITTILGRRIRFKLYEPKFKNKKSIPLPYNTAIEAYGHDIKLAGTYKAVNYKLQGSATGDVIKLAMLTTYELGLFNEMSPTAQVHDELTFSAYALNDKVKRNIFEINRAMSNCIKLRVPLTFSWEAGLNWSDVKKFQFD